jgi:hypothetical protein
MTRPNRQMTDEEAIRYAEKVADYFLYSWGEELGSAIAHLILTQPEVLIPSLKMVGIDAVAKDTSIFLREFGSAIGQRDRERLVSLLMRDAPRWPKNDADSLVAQLPSLLAQARGLFAQGLQNIKSKPGATSKIRPHEYSALAALGDRLAPLVLFLLKERDARAKRTMREMIEYRQNDFPFESPFLLKHLDRLESILKDKILLKRAKKLPTRARLIADAMAGAEYNLKPRTSLERAREGRRVARLKLI